MTKQNSKLLHHFQVVELLTTSLRCETEIKVKNNSRINEG